MILFYISCLLFFTRVNSMSLGAPTCDALGVCASGTCPPGMDKVSPPVRNDKYSIRTGDGELNLDTTEYIPGEIMDIHVRTLGYNSKYIGILIYAVEYDEGGQYDESGCASPGCDGSVEVRTGSWVVAPGEPFRQSEICDEALTHKSAVHKNFHHTLHWRAPAAGTGKVIFRAIVKFGPTNGGHFYWPMQKDLVLEEGVARSNGLIWLHGGNGLSCKQTCREENLVCDEGSMSGNYDGFKSSFVCPFPLMSGCGADEKAMVWSDEQGDCFTQSKSCSKTAPTCSAKVSSGERFCPCQELALSRASPIAKSSKNQDTTGSSGGNGFGDVLQYWPYVAGVILGSLTGFTLVWACSRNGKTMETPLIEDLYMDITSVNENN